MKNEPKTNPISEKPKMNLNFYSTKDYDNKPPPATRKNKPKTNPIQTQTNPILFMDKTNPTLFPAKDYENKPRLRAPGKRTQNEPNSNPISPPPAIRNIYPAALGWTQYLSGGS